jgi:gliding motility-associated-like protein
VSLSVSGGNGGYTYQWSNTTQTTQNISGLGADTYQVIVTDQKGCQKDTFASVAQPPAIVIAYPLVHGDSCYGNTYGIAIIAVSGGTPGYTYAWSNGATTDTIRGLGVGIYTFTVTDGNNCTVAGSPIQITSPDSLSASASLVIDSCESGVGSISVTVSGGIAPYQYVWSPVSGSTGQLSSLMKGTYALSVTDAYGCTLSGIYDLGDTCQRDSLVFPTAFSPNGDSKNDTFAPVYYGPIDDYQFHIYNRWGQLIFETTDPTKGWDGNYKGKPQPEEIYSYFCTFSAYGRARAREGTFTLLR